VIRVVDFDRLTKDRQLDVPREHVRRIPVRPILASFARLGRPAENEPREFRTRQVVAFASQQRWGANEISAGPWSALPWPVADLAADLFMVGTLGRIDGVEVVELVIADTEILGAHMLITIEGPTGMPRWRSPTVEDTAIERLIQRHVTEHATAVYVREVCR
jgi:hypothetical protein